MCLRRMPGSLSYKGHAGGRIMLRIDVVDTGTGIPHDIVDKDFRAVFFFDQGSRQGYRARAFLSTVYGHRQAGPAVLSMSTPRQAQATSFRIFLPRHHAEQEMPEAAGDGRGPGAGGGQSARRLDLTGQGHHHCWSRDEDGLRSLNARGLRFARLTA